MRFNRHIYRESKNKIILWSILKMKTLIIYKSIHLGSTKIIAEIMGKILYADVIEANEFNADNIGNYDLIGFGSGIYDDTFHKSIFKLIEKLPSINKNNVFLFSTAGVIYDKSHREIRKKLTNKNANIIDEFFCKGLNKNSFLKYIGGMNKGRPNAADLENAEQFAKGIILKLKLNTKQ